MGDCFNKHATSSEPKNYVKKGLMIGINYTGTQSALNGCINDQENLKGYLEGNSYMFPNDLTLMNDNEKGEFYPNKQNILNQMDELVKFANDNKDKDVYLLFAYSGHGTSIYDKNRDEIDGRDEALCPIDYDKSGFISDDVIKARLVDKLHNRVNLVMIMDCCHSGTIVDLQYSYTFDAKDRILVNNKVKRDNCNVVMISGCMDSQTSADAHIIDMTQLRYEYQGAMTASFLACYSDDMCYKELINKMRVWLKDKNYTQIPQLSSSQELDLNTPYLLTKYN